MLASAGKTHKLNRTCTEYDDRCSCTNMMASIEQQDTLSMEVTLQAYTVQSEQRKTSKVY
jgi:hypothetical protein